MVWRDQCGRLATVGLMLTAWWLAYSRINAFNARADRAIYLAPTPAEMYPGLIQPTTSVIYVLGSLALLVLPLLRCWQQPRFRQFMLMIGLGSLCGFGTYLAYPLNIRRPDFDGQRLGDSIMAWIVSMDPSANCFPSFHNFFAILGALVVTRHSRHWLEAWGSWLVAIAVVISTITTGQHYVIDAVGGIVLAVICFVVVQRLEGRESHSRPQ